mmetsp:Transcript_7014/g.17914  ORF Transcript_7014/g.17914 Transcript_7014/m.17914 type:complete len:149 (-) Transcript_7014:351-797(-)
MGACVGKEAGVGDGLGKGEDLSFEEAEAAAAREVSPEEESRAEQGQEESAPPAGEEDSKALVATVKIQAVQKSKKRVKSQSEWYEFGIDADVAECLRSCGMDEYIPHFAYHHVEAETLPHLTTEDLKAMHVYRVGHRRKLLLAFDAEE